MIFIKNKFLNPLIFGFPIIFMAVPGLTTLWITLIFFLCVILLTNSHYYKKINFKLWLIGLGVFGGYLLSIILTQLYWLNFDISEYQQQGRILLLLPLFFYIYSNKINLTLMTKYAIPVATIAGAIVSYYFHKTLIIQWGERYTVPHIDPLNFGFLMLFLAFASLMIFLKYSNNIFLKLLCLMSFILGIYMSLKSGSRTGWMAIPVVIYWLLISNNIKKSPSFFLTLFISLLFAITLYNTSSTAKNRFDLLTSEVKNYNWSEKSIANETSVGIRISLLRISTILFLESPLLGFGTQNLSNFIVNNEEIKSFADDVTISFASSAVMHNEIASQAVKHGIIGVLAFVLTLAYFLKIKKLVYLKNKESTFFDVFIIYMIFFIISSFSTEVLIVKPPILFFAFMSACYLGESLWRLDE